MDTLTVSKIVDDANDALGGLGGLVVAFLGIATAHWMMRKLTSLAPAVPVKSKGRIRMRAEGRSFRNSSTRRVNAHGRIGRTRRVCV